jgi:phosphoserine aminotransferase
MSHRSPHYAKINEGSQKAIKQFYNVPSNFEVLYLPTNCAHPSLPFNLCKATNGRAIYIVNDSESQHAYE